MTIKPIIPSVAVAAAVAAVVTVILPLQSFLGNESLYPFGIARLSIELGVVFAAATAALSAVFAVVGRRFRGAAQWLAVAAAVAKKDAEVNARFAKIENSVNGIESSIDDLKKLIISKLNG